MMTEKYKRDPLGLLGWQKKNVAFYLATATLAWVLIEPAGFDFLALPVMPISIVGAAIGIFTSFRANQAYDRWWEGRKLWGRLINTSRHWSSQVGHYLGEQGDQRDALVLRQVTYVHVLRCLLRGQKPADDPHVQRSLRPEEAALLDTTNPTHALLDRQMATLATLADQGQLDPLRLQSLDGTLYDLLNIQGGCERIKGTPLPRGYGYIAELLVQLFSLMLPFALVHELGVVAIPINALVCLSFALIGEAGRVLEDPFSLFYNGLPLENLSVKIEQNLREIIDRGPLPPTVQASAKGVLM